MKEAAMDEIKVLVVDDSLLFREVLQKGLKQYGDIRIIGIAADPFEAKDKILALKPDVVTLDVEMPRMDGIRFLRNLMPQFPLPVLVISSLKESVFEALDAGAVDFISKPEDLSGDMGTFARELAEKIRIASKAKMAFRRVPQGSIELNVEGIKGAVDSSSIVAMGASTGGTEAIYSILSKFSANMPGFVITQHMPAGFTKLYAERLNEGTNLSVFEARDGDVIAPGKAFVAPGGFQMRVIKQSGGYVIRVDESPKVNGHRPSVDVLFDSVAEAAEGKAMGVILTGMGADGAKGMKKMRDRGGYTIGQDERSSVVYGMPMAAYLSGAVMVQLPLYRIPDEICRKLSSQ
jgi:two-component system chemotaxis response regulator CheB